MTTKKTIAKKTTKVASTKGKAAPAKGKGKPAAKAAPVKAAPPTAPTPRHTKKADAIAALRKGITLEALMQRFGWQRHTVRGFISILGKTHKIESTSVEGKRTYKLS